MQFDKLYHLILQSIISQNKATRKNMIQKAIQKAIMKPSVGTRWLTYFATLDNKTADFLCKFVADGTIIQRSDERIQKVKKILELKNSIDTQSFKGSLDQFIKQNSKMLDKHQQKVTAQSIQFLDSIPEFSQKKQYPKGIVIYKVADTKEAQKAVRKLIDLQWGTSSNPWCLIARESYAEDEEEQMEQAWYHWNQYNAYPKHIAFQKGKLLAFCANENEQNLWWDREDKPSSKLKLLDDSQITTPKFQWSGDYRAKKLIKKYKNILKYNQQTDLYDVEGNITIQNKDLYNGHFPIKFGKVKGSFDCSDCKKLISLEGAPEEVGGEFNVYHCQNLTSLKGAPKIVKGSFDCSQCYSLTSLEGAPTSSGHFYCWRCYKLTSLIGAPKEVSGEFDCSHCQNLTSLQGASKKVTENFYCYKCPNLTSLQGAPEQIGGSFICSNCPKLKITEQDKQKYKFEKMK